MSEQTSPIDRVIGETRRRGADVARDLGHSADFVDLVERALQYAEDNPPPPDATGFNSFSIRTRHALGNLLRSLQPDDPE